MSEIYTTGEDFLKAVDKLCDWMNGNDLSWDHSTQRPDDFNHLCRAMTAFRAALEKGES
jgi:hypothetical protein